MFYLPHAIFKAWEGGKVRTIIAGLNQLILDKGERTDKERILADYFVESLHSHNLWALKLLFIEFLNLVTISQTFYQHLFVPKCFSQLFTNIVWILIVFSAKEYQRKSCSYNVAYSKLTT
jgi:hypothetical protein